jgi:hypothetical protein
MHVLRGISYTLHTPESGSRDLPVGAAYYLEPADSIAYYFRLDWAVACTLAPGAIASEIRDNASTREAWPSYVGAYTALKPDQATTTGHTTKFLDRCAN